MSVGTSCLVIDLDGPLLMFKVMIFQLIYQWCISVLDDGIIPAMLREVVFTWMSLHSVNPFNCVDMHYCY